MYPPYEPPSTPTRPASVADDVAAVGRPVAGRAARVAHHHGVARARVHLRLVEEPPPVLGERPAVDHQQHRMRTGALRPHHPAVHRVPIGCARLDLGHRVDAARSQLGAERGQHPFVAVADRDELTGGRRVGDRRDQPAASDGIPLHLPMAGQHGPRLAAAVGGEEQLDRAAVLVREQHALGGRLDGTGVRDAVALGVGQPARLGRPVGRHRP
ncbi:MAG: hypothetical protein ACRDPT_17485, partial [Streptomycetales bacterium]